MKLDVPFFKQTTNLNCGPMALKMVLSYFGNDVGIDLLEEKSGVLEGKGISTIQIAIASTLLGFKSKLVSANLSFNEKNLELDFYKQYSALDAEKSRELFRKARKIGLEMEEKSLSQDEIFSGVSENSLPIILLDWNVVLGKKGDGYQGHFVPVVGYDDGNVFVHNHGPKDPLPFFPIKKNIFEEARKAKGTDEDVVFVSRRG